MKHESILDVTRTCPRPAPAAPAHLSRRRVLAGAAGLAVAPFLGGPGWADAPAALRLGSPRPFSWEGLTDKARALAGEPYRAPPALPADIIDRLDYEALGKIRFDPQCALFRDGPGDFPVTFFHPGRFAATPVRVFALTGTGTASAAREVLYDPACFRMPSDSPAHELRNGGFAGLRLQESRDPAAHAPDWHNNDWVAFLGASYFRAIGELYQYGISARGIAIDTAVAGSPEEFPAFTRFYLAPGASGSSEMTVYALLEGPSVAGAYRFVLQRRQAVIMDIEARLFMRRAVTRLGLAPLTSMYWFSETSKPRAIDWRPEVHDSDGLKLWTGAGEHLWRPLQTPRESVVSSFLDRSPRGFGLLQRDRNFDHYLDGVRYERRPSLWVEPLGDWGAGSVQLVENPTDDEIHDNIVAFWVPGAPVTAGAALTLRYRLYWSAEEPFPSPLAQCVATRIGRGGQPGQPRPAGVTKFMVEFLGGPLAKLPFGVIPEVVPSAAHGHFSYLFAEAVPDGVAGHWRAQFDYTPEGPAPVDLRMFLRLDGRALSETWLYQLRAQEHA